MTPRPSALALAAGALLGTALATFTPGLLFAAQAMNALYGHTVAAAFHLLLAAWGALAGVVVVRERFRGNARRSAWLIALCIAIYAFTGFAYTIVEAAQGGSDAFGALILLGSIALGVTALSSLAGLLTWFLLRQFAARLLADSAPLPDAEARLTRRAARWLLAASAAQVATGVFGGPVVAGVLVALAASWFFVRAGAKFKPWWGLIAAACVALAGFGGQASLWATQAHDLKRAALPACADADSETSPITPGAYGRAARAVPGVRDAIALLRLDMAQQPSVVYRVFVTVRPAQGAAAADVQRAVEQALAKVDCDEGTQLGRVPAVVRVPGNRPLHMEAVVRLQPGSTLDGVRAELEPKLSAALARTPLSASGPRLTLPAPSELGGVSDLAWRIDDNPYFAGESLRDTGNVDMPVLGHLDVTESTSDGGAH